MTIMERHLIVLINQAKSEKKNLKEGKKAETPTLPNQIAADGEIQGESNERRNGSSRPSTKQHTR